MSNEVEAYTIGQAHNIDHLASGVNAHIMKGWVPSGGIAVAQVMTEEGPQTMYIQALVKYKSPILVPKR